MYNEQELLSAVEESFHKYKVHGARSTEKLKPLHNYIATILNQIWGKEFEIHYMGANNKEATVEGKYYPKDIDIAITKGKVAVFCLGIKFVTSNYKQNANNYFENMMGETANIQANKIPYAHLIILRYQTPYYKKNITDVHAKLEIINKKDLQKYLNLMFDSQQAHRPQILCIQLVNINEKTGKVEATDLNKVFDSEFAKMVEHKLSPKSLFKDIAEYKTFYNTNFENH